MALTVRKANPSQRISLHFTEGEFMCKCGCGMILYNPVLIHRLEQLRYKLGSRPIIINSGYRCTKHNKAVGGASNSLHLYGQAADISVYDLSPAKVYDTAVNMFDGVGKYSTFTHVDTRGYPARWKG